VTSNTAVPRSAHVRNVKKRRNIGQAPGKFVLCHRKKRSFEMGEQERTTTKPGEASKYPRPGNVERPAGAEREKKKKTSKDQLGVSTDVTKV